MAASASIAVRLTLWNASEQSMRIRHFFSSGCIRARSDTCSTPPRTSTPNCHASLLIFSRGRHCRMVPAARRRLHVIATQTERLSSPKPVRLDFKKSCQNSGGKALGSSMIRLQKALLPAPNFSRPKPVLIITCERKKHRPSLPAPDSAFQEFMTPRSI